MKIKKYRAGKANIVLAGLVMNATVCTRVSAKWEHPGLFASRWQNVVARWAIRHLEKYSEPLGEKNVEIVFQEWAAKREDATSAISSMEKFLNQFDEKLCEKVEGMSAEYILDLAGDVFNEVQVREKIRLAESDMEENNVDIALSRLSGSLRVELGVGSLFKPGVDYERWRDAFDVDHVKSLITYPGALGEFIGEDFCRESFVSFLGSTGVGKSWWLLDAAYRGTRCRRRVAFFEVGDQSENQFIRRMGQRALRRPRWDSLICWPRDWDGEGNPIVRKDRRLSVTPQESFKAWKKVQRGADLFRLSCHANVSLNVLGLESILLGWQNEGWVADIVVVDYADILAPPAGVVDKREQTNTTWQHLRRISQDYHCLVLTATQGDTESYDRKLLSKRNFSDDRRKNDHVTAEIGLNMSDEEKDIGMYRLNWLKRRDAEFNEKKQLKVGSCLAVGCPAITSSF